MICGCMGKEKRKDCRIQFGKAWRSVGLSRRVEIQLLLFSFPLLQAPKNHDSFFHFKLH